MAENRENIINILQSPRKIAEPTAIVRNLEHESSENFDLYSVMFSKMRNPPLHYRLI
jgi:hypothetical protein